MYSCLPFHLLPTFPFLQFIFHHCLASLFFFLPTFPFLISINVSILSFLLSPLKTAISYFLLLFLFTFQCFLAVLSQYSFTLSQSVDQSVKWSIRRGARRLAHLLMFVHWVPPCRSSCWSPWHFENLITGNLIQAWDLRASNWPPPVCIVTYRDNPASVVDFEAVSQVLARSTLIMLEHVVPKASARFP